MGGIAGRFDVRSANTLQLIGIEKTRELYLEFALELDALLPESREKSLCITHLEDSSMRAIRAILGF